jgi:hypothetical protein
MSTISLKKGAPAEITIPEIQKRYRISLKTDLAFQRFRTLLASLQHPVIFPQLFHCPKLIFQHCGIPEPAISPDHRPKLTFQHCGIPEPAISPDHCSKLPSYVAATLAASSRRSTVQNSSSNVAVSLDPPSHQTTAQSYLPMFQHH